MIGNTNFEPQFSDMLCPPIKNNSSLIISTSVRPKLYSVIIIITIMMCWISSVRICESFFSFLVYKYVGNILDFTSLPTKLNIFTIWLFFALYRQVCWLLSKFILWTSYSQLLDLCFVDDLVIHSASHLVIP